VNIAAIPDAVLQHCFSFIGPGHYRNVAGTSHLFRDIYNIKHEKKTTWESAAASVACAEKCLEDAREKGEDASEALVQIAHEVIKVGQVDMLNWAHQNGCMWKLSIFSEAGKFGHVCVLEWAEAKQLDWYSRELVYYAVSHGHINVLEWLVSCGKEMPKSAPHDGTMLQLVGKLQSSSGWRSMT